MNIYTGESIQNRRQEMNMSQEDLAEELGTYRQLISEVECGYVDDEQLIEDIAFALNVYPEDLI